MKNDIKDIYESSEKDFYKIPDLNNLKSVFVKQNTKFFSFYKENLKEIKFNIPKDFKAREIIIGDNYYYISVQLCFLDNDWYNLPLLAKKS